MASSNPTGDGSVFGNQIDYDNPTRNTEYENQRLIWDILHPPIHNATQAAIDAATTETTAKVPSTSLFVFIAIVFIFLK